jgi:hypothetical protein
MYRYLFFARKKIKTIAFGLRPSAVIGRFVGPKVLINSIPKAGTNMLERVLDHFPLLRNSGQRTLRGWKALDNNTRNRIIGIKRGQFFTAHLPAHEEILAPIKSEGIRVLLMIRDPRDIVVSYCKYVTSIDLTHKAHGYFSSLKDDDSRLMAMINGVDHIVSPISEALSRFEGWLDQDNVLVIRFEDLIGREGGGDDVNQRRIVESIGKHLLMELTDKQIQRICENIYSKKTLTFRTGKIGNWRNCLKSHHIDAFKENVGEMLVRYGYETNNDW